MIEALLSAGASIDVVNNSGYTALHHAAERNQPAAIETLLRGGADSSIRTQRGKTALDIAEELKHESAAALLREVTVTPGSEAIDEGGTSTRE